MGTNVIPGSTMDQYSYCGELGDLYEMILMVELLCLHHKIDTGAIEIGRNGLKVLIKSFGDFHLPYTAVDYDLLAAIGVKLKRSRITWQYRNVKGHQDSKGNTVLDCWALLNIEMDLLAKVKHAQEEHKPSPRHWTIQDEPWRFSIVEVKQTKNFAANT